MWDDDDFLLSFEKQVKSDIEEFLGLNPEFFKIGTYGYKGRVTSWRRLPHVSWEYNVPNPKREGAFLAQYGGWMLMNANWTDLHRQIMGELGVLADTISEKLEDALTEYEMVASWGHTQISYTAVLKSEFPSHRTTHNFSWDMSAKEAARKAIATLPYVPGDKDDSRGSLPPHRNGYVAGPFRVRPNSDWSDPNERQSDAIHNQSDDLPF